MFLYTFSRNYGIIMIYFKDIFMIPEFIKPFLWSYDVSAFDLRRDKKRIITNILNWGTYEATNWLFSVYSQDDIREVLEQPLSGEWDKKSLAYWSLIYNIPVRPQAIRTIS